MSPREMIARLKQYRIEWFAITDHNSMANCPAYAKVAAEAGMGYSWGVEIQSSEEIHLLAYFDDPEKAVAFDRELYASLLPLPNDPDFFGDQVVIDENDNILRVEQLALINSSQWDINTTVEQVEAFGGLVVPAHVDAGINSILSQLGFIPDKPEFAAFGITALLNADAWRSEHPYFAQRSLIRASDAHYLDDIGKGYSELYVENASIAELKLAAERQAGRMIK